MWDFPPFFFSAFPWWRWLVGCHNEKVKFMEFLLSAFFTPGSSLAVLAASKPDIFPAAAAALSHRFHLL